jgi:hypothetical protein
MSEENILFFNDRRLVHGSEEVVPSRGKFGSRNRINQVLAEARASVNHDDEDAPAVQTVDWMRPSLKVLIPIIFTPPIYSLTHLFFFVGSLTTIHTSQSGCQDVY